MDSSFDLEMRLLCVGKLDVEGVALAGHSYGGATVTALCSQEPAFKCTVALDPWWSVTICLSFAFCHFTVLEYDLHSTRLQQLAS